MNKITLLFTPFLLWYCGGSNQEFISEDGDNFTRYVDPYIGTDFHGHVFLGANVPFGAVQLGPTNLTEGWDWCSGYHYSDTTVIGFAHTHLSGTGIGDLGDILLMPTAGELNFNRGTLKSLDSGYVAYYHHNDETVRPGYYRVWLDKYKVSTELTATERVGFHKYTFQTDSLASNLILDLERGIGWDSPVETFVERINDTTVVGYRYSKGWAVDQKIYFAIQLSRPMSSFMIEGEEGVTGISPAKKERLKAAFIFNESVHKELLVKVGISAVSIANALENIRVELPHWNFDKVVADADARWNQELSKIEVKMDTDEQTRVFYTSLYHTMIAPSVFSDANGEYRGADGKVYTDTTFTSYTTFSLWDTYRGAHPLFTLTQRERMEDFVQTFLKIYQQQGKLPIWHLAGNETDCMVGYPAIPVIADAYFKGFDMDAELAFEAMKASSMRDDYGMTFIKQKGYIPADLEKESVAKALEYCISDWCIAQMAKALGKTEDYEYYSKRAKAYEMYFDQKTHFMRAKMEDGTFREPFDPFKSTHIWGDYTEGNAWQYTWLVPQDAAGLIGLFGGPEAIEEKLDSLFLAKGDLGKDASADITGLVGQYAHGNEPSHHITYLYSYVGKPWKTAEKVRYIMDNLYTDKPNGLCGNEDVGQMSAWYVLSALGFYQVNPANGKFIFGSPMVESAVIRLGEGKRFTISRLNGGGKNIYIKNMELGGKPYQQSHISYEQLVEGGELRIEMDSIPSRWGTAGEYRPASALH